MKLPRPVVLRNLSGAIALIGAVLAAPVHAAPCGGFTDVDSTSVSAAFCQNVEWIKNRQVTLGCSSTTLYCPGQNVTRLQMAAFMNRLGTALTPVQLRVDAAQGAIDVDANTVVCQTTDFEVENFPRRAYADVSFMGTAPSDSGLAADLVVSTNAGANWTPLNTVTNRGFVAANQWGALSDLATADLQVGETARFGVRVSRAGLTGVDLTDSRCQLRILVYSRTGAASPF